MPEGETNPKENTSKAWLAHADNLNKKLISHATSRTWNIGPRFLGLGIGPRKGLNDDYSRVLSDKELAARSKGMALLREEKKRAGMARGGKVRATGVRTLHKGEMVVRKTNRCKSRSSGR